MTKSTTLFLSALVFSLSVLFSSCNDQQSTSSVPVKEKKKPIVRKLPPAFTYSLVNRKIWLKQNDSLLNEAAMDILQAVNRTDAASLRQLDSIIVPSSFDGDAAFYLHFPMTVSSLAEVSKVLLFSYPTQTFAAYENGELVYSGPTNMGRKKDPTPAGLYFCNWKAEETISTFNDEWELKWNFNIENKEGIGFHQYALPGYPASHSCLRLREQDAKFLYEWAQQWELKGTDDILAKGTPVIVFGTYSFDAEKPWKQLVNNPNILNMDGATIDRVIAPVKDTIVAEQQKREAYLASAAKEG